MPQSLNDLKLAGDWDQIAIQSVSYKRVGKGYELTVERDLFEQPEMNYPDDLWQGLGLI